MDQPHLEPLDNVNVVVRTAGMQRYSPAVAREEGLRRKVQSLQAEVEHLGDRLTAQLATNDRLRARIAELEARP